MWKSWTPLLTVSFKGYQVTAIGGWLAKIINYPHQQVKVRNALLSINRIYCDYGLII